jgi:bifunctional DNA-binding transcriptional regulator/antitoxin component of YhaV-PrlF toxin-antitoxin module
MAKVTSKLQVTIPKAIADAYGIRPGASLDWVPAGDSIRVTAAKPESEVDVIRRRLEAFDEATARQALRDQACSPPICGPTPTRGASPRFSARTFNMDESTALSASSIRLLIDCGRRELFWAGTHPRLR